MPDETTTPTDDSGRRVVTSRREVLRAAIAFCVDEGRNVEMAGKIVAAFAPVQSFSEALRQGDVERALDVVDEIVARLFPGCEL